MIWNRQLLSLSDSAQTFHGFGYHPWLPEILVILCNNKENIFKKIVTQNKLFKSVTIIHFRRMITLGFSKVQLFEQVFLKTLAQINELDNSICSFDNTCPWISANVHELYQLIIVPIELSHSNKLNTRIIYPKTFDKYSFRSTNLIVLVSFIHPENIRKPLVFWCFQWLYKENSALK